MFIIIVCAASALLFASCNKTPGQKLDRALDSASEKVKNTKEAVEDRYDDAKKTAKNEYRDARKELSEKIKP